MNITAEQIYAIECIDKIEELYLNELTQGGDSDETRKRIEPLRQSIEYLKKMYEVTADARNDYYRYVQALRDSHIYADKLRELKNKLNESE